MKSQRVIYIAVAAVLGALVMSSTLLAAQEQGPTHRRYKLVEIGTFGGPSSVFNVFSIIARNDGTVVGAANTSTPDPYAPDCFDGTCFVQHAWKWHKGVLTDLGVLPDGYSSYTNAINAQGLIVGQSQNGEFDAFTGVPSFVATIWNHGKIKSLGTFGGGFSIAIAATDQNFVMGAAENGTIDTSGFGESFGFSGVAEIHAFGWKGGSIFDLGNLGGPGAFPSMMNNVGQVVGFSPTSSIPGPLGFPPVDPFLWENGSMRDLGTLGGTFGEANAINNLGQVVGGSDLAGDLTTHAFLWEHGKKMRDLGTLGGCCAAAQWLNDAGQVIGLGTTAGDEALHAVVWNHGSITDLGTVGDDNSSNAIGINVAGQVVGESWFWDGQNVTASHAFLWEESGPMVDLNTLVSPSSNLDLFEANFITDRGEIVARGFTSTGDVHTAILIPDGDPTEFTPAVTSNPRIATVPPSRRSKLTDEVHRHLKTMRRFRLGRSSVGGRG